MGTDTFPGAALEWMAPTGAGELLAIGAVSVPMARRMLPDGQGFCLIDRTPDALARQHRRSPEVKVAAASANALPFGAGTFSAVVVSNDLGDLDPDRAYREIARVLVPGGRLVMHVTLRDDTVPWVRRLAAIMHRVDPSSMADNAQLPLMRSLADSPYFLSVEHRDFRMWVPITRPELLIQTGANERVASLDDTARGRVLNEVGQLYDSSARAPEPLLLPYTVACWRAEVDQSEFSLPLRFFDDGFPISL